MANQALTVIKIIKGAPCDDTYSDVIKFGSAGAQAAYFSGLAKYTFSNCSYQRVNNSVASPRSPLTCRIPTVADNVYDCNYVMFQNQAFGSKWFYGFIRRINYINPDTTEIEYEIDSYQTYQFDYTVKPSLVEREHSATDAFGENFEVEPVSIDRYVALSKQGKYFTVSPAKVVASTDSTGRTADPSYIGNWLCGAKVYDIPSKPNTDEIKNILTQFATEGHIENVVDIVQLLAIPEGITKVNLGSPSSEVSFSGNGNIPDYTPHNKKLLQYPFVYYEVNNKSNASEIFKPELFEGDVEFWIEENKGLPNTATLRAPSYAQADNILIDTPDLPPTMWTGNYVQARLQNYARAAGTTWVWSWLANTTSNLIKTDLRTRNLPFDSASGAELRGNAVANVANEFVQRGIDFYNNVQNIVQSATPMNGRGSSGQYNLQHDKVGFYFIKWGITAQNAKCIDDFFDMYGYALNRVKVPNEDSRESWNYVKTNNVIINGSMPVQDMVVIKAMYNKGVRFWHTTDVGNYSLSNAIKKEVVTDDVG